ncbi:MAG: DUF624 domain-containing protein [Oscillospiraceae bacterium]|nr:DUF624 domain-containing protein [Oscillospiraceae bacterium]
MAIPFFDPQNHFWGAIGKFADVLVLSLLWLFCSLPVFTIGAATTALYDAAARCVRGGENGPYERFFRTFRREFAVSTAVTVVWGVLLAALGALLGLLWGAAKGGAVTAAAVACSFLFLLIPVGAACWMFPLLSRFTFRPVGLMLAGLRFAVGYLPYTAAIAAITAAAALACGFLWLPALVLPCLTALLWSLMMERVFRKHTPEGEPPPPEEEAA